MTIEEAKKLKAAVESRISDAVTELIDAGLLVGEVRIHLQSNLAGQQEVGSVRVSLGIR